MCCRNVFILFLLVAFSTTGCATTGDSDLLEFALDVADNALQGARDQEKVNQALAVSGAVLGAAVIGGVIGYYVHKNKQKKKRANSSKSVTKLDINPGEWKSTPGQILMTDLENQAFVLQCDIHPECIMSSSDYTILRKQLESGVTIQSFACPIASRQVAELLPILSSDEARGQAAKLMHASACDPENWPLVYKHIRNLQVLLELEESLSVEE